MFVIVPKNNKMKRLLILFAASLITLFTSCTHRARVSMDVMRPADITLSSKIEGFLLLDRSQLDKKNKLGLLEGILTGELPEEDKAAVQRALSQLNSTFQSSPRFHATIAQERLEGNSLTAAFPAQIEWKEIERLCKKYNTEAVLAIELFDTDFIITKGKRKTKKTVGEGDNKREVEVDEFYAKGVANVTMGIRVYDAINKKVIDEQFFKRTNTWEEAANSKAEALAKLIMKGDASSRLSAQIADQYAYRIAPLPVRISRSYFRKHKKAPSIEVGARMAQVNRWEDALTEWEQGVNYADMKRAGYLRFNTAVAHEVLGDLDAAIQSAQDAYIKYGNKDAQGYVRTLERRRTDEARLEEQQ